jgi:dethiobiotin synthase
MKTPVQLKFYRLRNLPDMRSKTIFITGTDTGVGKTVLTACLLHHLLESGKDVLAIKPFCSGSRADVELLQAVQGSRLPDQEMNPFYFSEPVAPLVAARKTRRKILLSEVLKSIRGVERQCECLLIEGSGGLLVPLGEGYMVVDLIQQLQCTVLVVARNRLGTINHTLLTVQALRSRAPEQIKVILRDEVKPDISARTNRTILAETLAPIEVLPFPFLGAAGARLEVIKKNAKKVKNIVASLFG